MNDRLNRYFEFCQIGAEPTSAVMIKYNLLMREIDAKNSNNTINKIDSPREQSQFNIGALNKLTNTNIKTGANDNPTAWLGIIGNNEKINKIIIL